MRLSLFRIMIALLAFAGAAFASDLDLRQLNGLESRVEFWKKVFTQYGQDDVILHDRANVHLIYDVVKDDAVESRTAQVKRGLQEIAANLKTPENLSPAARQIRSAIVDSGIPVSASTIEQLRGNIHTQRGIKERFRDGIVRSGRYVDSFRETFAKEGVPAAIALLPLVESSFENQAFSTAGAAGIWQFTRGTGRLYMRVSGKVDERLDPAKATNAAARLLRDNYKALGSWPLAITAYNHGRAGMMRAKEAAGPELPSIIDNYRGRLFGYASANFFSEFVAAVQVYENYTQHFGELVLDKPGGTITPTIVAARPRQAAAAVSDKYKVRKGDTLGRIARQFDTTIRELMAKNNLRNATIYAGQILAIE